MFVWLLPFWTAQAEKEGSVPLVGTSGGLSRSAWLRLSLGGWHLALALQRTSAHSILSHLFLFLGFSVEGFRLERSRRTGARG